MAGVAFHGSPANTHVIYTSGQWKLVVEATVFVTSEVVVVWSGVKTGGNDPVGVYTRVGGCDPTETLTVEAV